MQVDNDLITRFAKVVQFNTGKKDASTVRGTVHIADDGRTYIQIDGSEADSRTPAETTVEVSEGDRVIATMKDHSVVITGNKTHPSVGTVTAGNLSSEISQTAEKIRSEVKDTASGLSSTITQTASEIRAKVEDTASALESTISQTASQINTRIDNLGGVDEEEFTEFKQTIEGFYFTDEEGTVFIDGGSVYAKNLNLSGAIVWGDLSSTAQNKINTLVDGAVGIAEAADAVANEAYNLAEDAMSAAEAAELPTYIKSTYIDETRIESPEIIGGRFYAVGVDPEDANTFSVMDEDGFYIYYNQTQADSNDDGDRLIPKVSLRTYDSGKDIRLMLGSGESANNEWYNRFYISKQSNRVDMQYVTDYDGGALGFTFLKDRDIVTVHGTLEGTTGLFPIGYIYMSMDTTNPAGLFGGDWERIEGHFIYATGSDSKVGDIGTTGSGSAVSYINVAAWQRVG